MAALHEAGVTGVQGRIFLDNGAHRAEASGVADRFFRALLSGRVLKPAQLAE